ncbi:MAG: family 16 glycosylhydrolase [Muribaculaceae bacterium]|nr:family 16 glycosylhydrolase [Muribaculaceae bacterium]
MKKTILLSLLTTLALGANAQWLNFDPSLSGYELVFSDEFDGNTLNNNVWNIEVNGNGGGNNELQFYSANNVSVSNGALQITSRRENYQGRSFTSGRINSMGKVAFKHGIVQASIKLPSTANGLWPAFWLMGNDMSTGTSWPYCGEIDVLEAGGSPGIAAGTQDRFFISALHWGPYNNGDHPMYSRSNTSSYSLQDGEYHLYTMVWDEQKISMYLDNQTTPYFEMNIEDKSQQNSAGNYFHKQFFLLFNVAIGGNIPGIFDASGITALNNGERSMSVDYVRIYQKSDEKDYISPSGSEGGEDPEIPEDTTTNLGRYGSLSLDENGHTTFDFANSSDYVLIGVSPGVKDQMGASNIRADYNVDDVKNFLWVWENTYTAQTSQGVNSFGLEETYNHYRVNSVGWSGLGYASQGTGKDLSMLDEDGYILHFAMRGTDHLMHTNQGIYIGAAGFCIGNAVFRDGAKELPVLGDYKRDGRWCSFDIPVSVIKSLVSPLFDNETNFLGNVFAVLSGGISGAEVQFDNIFFYKNPTVDTNLPTDDEDTVLGKYALRALDDQGHYTFDFADGYDYVVIGASQGAIDNMQNNILANYSVDDVKHFLYIWENTYNTVESEGVNSLGLNEEYNHYTVGTAGWSGLGYASNTGTGRGKDLSMLDNTYYLHFAMKGNDIIRHTNHTIGVGAAQFIIGNSTTAPVILGDFKRDGQWYNFDIPFSEFIMLAGDPFAADGGAADYQGNVISFLSGGNNGAELQFDNIFFYKRHSDDGNTPQYDTELGKYGSKSLDDDGKPTFDLSAHTDYVLISLGQKEAQSIKDVTLADYRPDDVKNFLYVWEGTYLSAAASGVNSFGENEGYNAYTVGTAGWSGLGFASTGGTGAGKDLSMLDDSFFLHIAFKDDNSNQHLSHAVGVGNAHFAVGNTPFVDGNKTYGLLGDFKRDGEWYSLDIPFSELTARARPVFTNAQDYMDNVVSFLSGGVQGTALNFDAVFFYRNPGSTLITGDVNGDNKVDVADVNAAINIILELKQPSDYEGNADITGDGKVDVSDVNAIINIILSE